MGNLDVVTIGESMVLFQPMSTGPLNYASLFTKTIAGAESNFAIALTRLGKRVRWISRLGADPFGDAIQSVLAGEGVDTSCVIRDPNAPTAIYFKEFKGYGDPNVYYYRKHSAASLLSPQDIRPGWFEDCRHLHVSGITPALGVHTAEAIREAMIQARKLGLTISFDPNLRRKLWSEEQARRVLLSLIPLCDIFLPGLEEAEFLLGEGGREDEYGREFLKSGAKLVVLKLGERGSRGYSGHEVIAAEPYKIAKVVDTVGAGDAFAAGLLSVLLDGDHPYSSDLIRRALQRANTMGALATQYIGDWEGLPALSEMANLEQGRKDITR